MKGKSPDPAQLNLLPQRLEDLVNPKHPLCKLAKRIPRDDLEKHFSHLYHHGGRLAKPIRLMVELLILKQLYNLSDESIEIEIYQQILNQQKNSTNNIYSLHEPQVYCISKGKEHKKYEFGSKSSIVLTKNSGVIVSAVSFSKNVYDGHTLPQALKQHEELVGKRASVAICDRGYRGKTMIDSTRIEIPKKPKKQASVYEKRKARKRFRKRAGIEPIIAHLKSDFRLLRNRLKGSVGDSINLMLAAAAYNFRKLMRQLLDYLLLFFEAFVPNLNASIFLNVSN